MRDITIPSHRAVNIHNEDHTLHNTLSQSYQIYTMRIPSHRAIRIYSEEHENTKHNVQDHIRTQNTFIRTILNYVRTEINHTHTVLNYVRTALFTSIEFRSIVVFVPQMSQ